MSRDDNASKAKKPRATRNSRTRTVAAKPDADLKHGEDQPTVNTDRPHTPVAEPALTLPVAEPATRKSIGLGLGAFAVVLLIGGSVALLTTREPRYPDVAAAQSDTLSITDAPSASPAPAPMPATSAAAQPPIPPAAPTPIFERANAPPPPTAVPTAPPTVTQAQPEPPRVSRRAAQQSELADVCASLPPIGRTRCIERPLDDADARLADAFDNAVDAGTPWPLLRRYRAAWDGLRSRAAEDPAGVASAYYALADELDDISHSRFGPR